MSVRSEAAYRHKLSIAVPASLVSDVPHLREKTLKIGLVGRAAAIFRVNEIIVFPDVPEVNQKRDFDLISTILSYMETPQYLRKRLFKIRPELKFAGVLPPLRTPHHPLTDQMKHLKVGEHRDGVAVSSAADGTLVDIGVEKPILVPKARLNPNTRVTVKITELGDLPKAALANRDQIETYWGYRITVSNLPFGQLIKKGAFDLVIATSRHGKPLKDVFDELKSRWKNSHRILVAFGAPTQGLYEIAAREGLKLEEIAHFVVNTIPNQGTQTIRTEEAVYASLAILNTLPTFNVENHVIKRW
jgi:predicted SPOUT superfamily RNA methylase MTH1